MLDFFKNIQYRTAPGFPSMSFYPMKTDPDRGPSENGFFIGDHSIQMIAANGVR
jgi:hypothetical protein